MDAHWLARTFSLDGKVVLVTGGAGGIGRVLAAAYLRAGARAHVTGRRQPAAESGGQGECDGPARVINVGSVYASTADVMNA